MKRALLELFTYVKKHPILIVLWIFFVFTNFAVTIRGGLQLCIESTCGIYIGTLHNPDSFWHASLVNTAFNRLPFEFPNFSGLSLQGYNYFFDLICFLIVKITHLSAFDIYFRLIPILYVFLFPVLTLLVSLRYTKSIYFVFSFCFFMFFGSSFAYIPAVLYSGKLSSFLYAQAMQSGRTLLNMQYGISVLFLQLSLFFLLKKKKHKKDYLTLAVVLIISTAIKFYIGPILLGMFIVNEFIIFLKDKKLMTLLASAALYIFCFFLSIVLFYNVSSSLRTGGLFAWSPLSLVHPIIESMDLFYMPNLVQMRYTLYALGGFSTRLIAIETISILLFILFNFGTRIIAFFSLADLFIRRKIKRFEIIVLVGIIIGLIPSLFFVQKGVWWNVVQFLGYSVFLSNFFAAKTLEYLLLNKRIFTVSFAMICILLTLPQNIEQLGFFSERRIDVTQEEISAYSFIKSQREKTVIALPIPENSVISAFSQKQLFIADTNVLTISGVDYERREYMLQPENWERGYESEKKKSLILINKDKDKNKKFQTFFLQKKEYKSIYETRTYIVYRHKE